jgi:hypothetical protein
MMLVNTETLLTYYAQPGPMTNAGQYAHLFDGLPQDVPELVQVIQNLVVHIFWAERYGLKLSEERQQEVQLRRIDQKLPRLLELDPASLTSPRPLERRLVGNCRDFSVLMVAILRHQGVPARARCGFGTYFLPGRFEDHWVVEYWHADEQRWVMVDAQLDDVQRKVLDIQFDPLDMPAGKFVVAGDAWQMCRRGEADPEMFGIFQWHGLDFIRGNLAREVLSFNKIEVLPWDFWGLLQHSVADAPAEELPLLDQLAEWTVQGDPAYSQLRSAYVDNPDFHAPVEWLGG